MILIELNGETLLVGSLAGYGGCTVIEEGVDPPPNGFCTRIKGQWVEDADAKAGADKAAALAAMSRAEMVAMIEGLIAEQSARVDGLQAQVEMVAASVTPGGDDPVV